MTVVITSGSAAGAITCTFEELLTEFYARGFDYLQQDPAGVVRAKRWLNEAYVEDICDIEPWPFLEAVATGTAPMSISNVRDVLYVTDQTNMARLPSTDIRDLVDLDPDGSPSTNGTPWGYYWDGQAIVRVYPHAPVSLTMRYISVPAELSADTDRPLLPRRFCPLIIEGAVVRANLDSDNYEAATQVQAQFDRRMAKMTDAMFSRNLDNGQYVSRTREHDG